MLETKPWNCVLSMSRRNLLQCGTGKVEMPVYLDHERALDWRYKRLGLRGVWCSRFCAEDGEGPHPVGSLTGSREVSVRMFRCLSWDLGCSAARQYKRGKENKACHGSCQSDIHL